MSSSLHIDNNKKKNKDLAKGPTQGLENTLSSKKMYSVIFTENKNFCSSLHYVK